MRLNIDTNINKFYRQLLELLSGFPPLDQLRNRELDLLAVYMYYNYKYMNIEESLRWRIINDTSTRRKMQEDLGMNEDIFNNNISLIRKSGVISRDGSLSKFLQVYPGDRFDLSITFKIDKDNG